MRAIGSPVDGFVLTSSPPPGRATQSLPQAPEFTGPIPSSSRIDFISGGGSTSARSFQQLDEAEIARIVDDLHLLFEPPKARPLVQRKRARMIEVAGVDPDAVRAVTP